MKKIFLLTVLLTAFNVSKSQDQAASKSIDCPYLIFKIGNGMSRMPSIALKKLTEAYVEMTDYSKFDYKLQGFTVTVLFHQTTTFKKAINSGNTFSEDTKALLYSVKPDDLIVVTGISVSDPAGNISYIRDRNFAFY